MTQRFVLAIGLASLLLLSVGAPAASRVQTLEQADPPIPAQAAAAGEPPAPVDERPAAKQRGLSSWYGRHFHGKKTASGEAFDMHAMTAAHRTLPFQTRVRVTNLANGRQVIVRINDRGPHRADRLIDLSQGAARALGFSGKGLARVELEVLPAHELEDLPRQ